MNGYDKNAALLAHIISFLKDMAPQQRVVKGYVRGGGRKKTKKGAVHHRGGHFIPRQINRVTPAEYRHLHMGRTAERWVVANGS